MMKPDEIAGHVRASIGAFKKIGASAFRNPVSAVLTALAAGFVFGLVLRLFERREK